MKYAASRFADSAQASHGRRTRWLVVVLVIAATTLVLAPSAAAERSVRGSLQITSPFPFQPGALVFPVGEPTPMDSTGGLPTAGDLYTHGVFVCGLSCYGQAGANSAFEGGFIRQLTPDGAHKRVWGAYVVASGPGDADETQAVRVSATAGSFTLAFGGETTDPIAYNAPAGVVQAGLNDFSAISAAGGSVSVTGGPGDSAGATPYIVSFDGGPLHGTNRPLIVADGSSLTGDVAVYTINQGDTGFEICSAAAGDACRFPKDSGDGVDISENGAHPGAVGTRPEALAINQTTGEVNVYTALRRINRYSATGEFLRSFGLDVVREGPGDSNIDEIQELTVNAVSGAYTLSVFVTSEGTQTTAAIPYDATPSQIEAAIQALPELADFGGSVSVSGSNPYTIAFDGASGGDSFNTFAGSPTSAATVKTVQDGGAPEICTPDDACKAGAVNAHFVAGGNDQLLAEIATAGSGNASIALAPPGAPNEGSMLVGGGNEVREFTPDGEFAGAFGWDVVKSGPGEVAAPDDQQQVTVKAASGTFSLTFRLRQTEAIPFDADPAQVESALNALSTIGGVGGSVEVTGGPGDPAGLNPYVITFGGEFAGDDVPQMTADTPAATVATLTNGGAFEVCQVDAGDVCTSGSSGSGLGQFSAVGGSTAVRSLAISDDGTIYTVESGGSEGNRRVQRFTPAGGGDLTPSHFGVGEVHELTVNASAGEFRLSAGGSTDGTTGTGDFTQGSKVIGDLTTATGEFKAGRPLFRFGSLDSIITAVGANTLTKSSTSPNTQDNVQLSSYLPYTTSDIAFNAPANGPGSVEEALNALPSISAGGGSVTVTGGPGGTSPYTITYHSPEPQSDFPDVGTSQGTTPLSGGVGPSAGQALVTTLNEGGPGGRSESDAPEKVGILPGGNVLVAKRFKAMDAICPDGFPIEFSFATRRLLEFTPDGLTLVDSSPACNIEPDFLFGEGDPVSVNASLGAIDPATGEIHSGARIWGEVGAEPELALNPATGVTSSGVTISGAVDPNGPGPIDRPNPAVTRYAVDYREVGEPEWTRYVSRVPVGSGGSPVPFSVGIGGLKPKSSYEARVLVVKPYGFSPVVQTIPSFTTLAGKPKVESPFAENVTANSVDLHAAINPSGAETTYRFEYGPGLDYGQSTAPMSVGDGAISVPVQAHLEHLEWVVYHFRVVATNSEGTTTSADQTFNFYPESCPNAAARQQTGSTRLPDCRAYELVSPGRMGSVSLSARGPSSALATNPPRFAFSGAFGTLPGPWNPANELGDNYVATRTPTGWETFYVGVQLDEDGAGRSNPGGSGEISGTSGNISLPGNLGLDRFLQWSLSSDLTGTSSAPHLFDAQGNKLARLPTNLAEIQGGDAPVEAGGFVGDQLLSGDGGHFFYSAANVPLAPGGLTAGAGSVYRNDIANQAVEIVSKTEAGADIPPAPGDANLGHFLLLPGASRDGSHILMAAPAGCTSLLAPTEPCPLDPSVLYMWAEGESYDVSEGRAVQFEGMTADGEEVFFTTAEQMPATGDTDTSIDLYMWSEAGDSLTRVSSGGDPVGNTDGCAAAWISGCGVEVVPDHNLLLNPGETNEAYGFRIPTDDAIASGSGAVYFYSPEQFVGSNGFPGRRNLYAAIDGQLRFVAALDADKPAIRIQVSPNGRFAAFITRSRLTSYDNEASDGVCSHTFSGQPIGPDCLEMYRYDAQREEVVCVSCEPTGAPPSNDVEGSRNGRFMTDDGRTFFATLDPLVPRDTDGLNDVYEFVDNQPQLITTGAATHGGSNYFGGPGLVGVSADGTDIYFSTLETLVPQDENGPFLKFYDARTNGGFPITPQVAPCAAADECHGPGSSDPAPAQLATTADLGGGGNVASHRKRKKHKKKRRRAHRPRHANGAHQKNSNPNRRPGR